MAWLSSADSVNRIRSVRDDWEKRNRQTSLFGLGLFTVKEKRRIVVTEDKYVGIHMDSAPAIKDSLSTTGSSSTVDVSAWYEENQDGSATVYHVQSDKSAAWETDT